MKVVTGTKIGPSRNVEVELEDADGERAFKGWGSFSVDVRFRKLAALADVMVLQYLYRDEEITTEVYNHRLGELAKEMQR